jgi:exo-1,4-beta-D-glucosaminidase
MTYEGERAMFEAYGREKYRATGVIQWMLNDAWPSVIWHLYDYYLRPGGGFYGTRKACEPLHIQFSYDDRSVVVVNSRYESVAGLTARARILNLDLAEKFRDQKTIDAGPDSATRVMTLPEPEGLSSTYFVKLELERDGQVVSDNFYWLSTRPDRLNWPLTQWYYTPALDYADFQALETLPPVELQVEARHVEEGGRGLSVVTVTNPSSSLAFMVRLRVMKGAGGEEALPVLWDDNYFSLLPGETKEVRAEYAMTDLAGAAPYALVTGWNAAPGGYR